MTAENTPKSEGEWEGTTSIITVPTNLMEQVMDYVESISSEELDTSGYMIGGIGGIGGSVAKPGMLRDAWSGTGCGNWQTGKSGGHDVGCADTD